MRTDEFANVVFIALALYFGSQDKRFWMYSAVALAAAAKVGYWLALYASSST